MSLVSLSLPERAMRLLDEARWFANAGAGVLLALILLTYDRADPGWSNSGPPREIHNAGGRVGAWLADLLLYLFGASTWIHRPYSSSRSGGKLLFLTRPANPDSRLT